MNPSGGRRHVSRSLSLRPLPPFRLDLTVWALRRRSRNLIDRWDGTTYRRVIVLGKRPTELAMRQIGSPTAPRVVVTATPFPRTLLERRQVRSIVVRLLGLRIDLTEWYRMAESDARLRPLADKFRGMKPPRFPTTFEAVVNAFACQQLSLEVGLELLNRLASISSPRIGMPRDARYAFPAAPDVAKLRPEECKAIGFSGQKVRALLGLARAITRRDVDLEFAPAGRRCGCSTMPARIARRRTVDGRIRATKRPRTPARVSRRRCGRSEANGSVAWAFATSGLHRRTTSRRTMAAVLRHGVLPPSTRGAIASRRPGIQILKLMVHRTWAHARLRGCTESELRR